MFPELPLANQPSIFTATWQSKNNTVGNPTGRSARDSEGEKTLQNL